MERRIKKWLYDILLAMDEIESFTKHGEMTYQEFLENIIVIRAVERDFGIIGEATNRILKRNPSIKITNARGIVDMRNAVNHGYDTISYEKIWSTLKDNFPALRVEVESLMNL